MAFIYKIVNDMNDKIYIGQTSFSIENRFKQHLKDSEKNLTTEKRSLYNAIRKYGKEHFKIELIEETDSPNEREKYWIKYYNTYKYGYNATMGGDGKILIDREKAIQLYKKYKNAVEVAKELRCSVDSLRKIFKDMNIKEEFHPKNSKETYQFDLDNNLLNIFWSSGDATEYIIKNDYSKGSKHSVANKIRECANNTYNRKTAFGFIWKYHS